VTAAGTGERSFHLLVFGLRWPPETFIAAKLEALAARGVRITVACSEGVSPPEPGSTAIRVAPVIPASRVGVARALGAVLRLLAVHPTRLPRVVRAARAPTAYGTGFRARDALGNLRAYAALAALDPDLVHFEWNTAALHYHSLVDALGRPSVVSVRGGDLEIYPHGPGLWFAQGYPVAFRRAAAVHCVSQATLREARAQGVRPAQAHVIRPAVDVAGFRPPESARPDDGVFRVAAVGWLTWRKGWEYTLQAVALLAAKGVDVQLEIVAPEPVAELDTPSDGLRVARAVAELGLEDRVTVRGQVGHGEVRDLLEHSDVLLHSSLAEGIPNVVLEAMACGLPVVATDVGGTGEAVEHGVTGYLVPPRDPRAAADALLELARAPDLRRALGRAARARVESGFSLEHQTDLWLELYEDVLALPEPAPLRLAEVGLDWPPEEYLQRKLQGLAERGIAVTVASTIEPGGTPVPLPGVSLRRIPHFSESRLRGGAGVAADALVLLASRPGRLARVLHGWHSVRRPLDRTTRALLLRLQLSLARIEADVVHFEWTSFAERSLSLFDVWRTPVVVSCHGSEVLVPTSANRPRKPAGLFGRAAAVHCVSRAVELGALALGASPAQTSVIPSAVDPAVFAPQAIEREREFLVVSVAALRWIKGLEFALTAIARLAATGVPVRFEVAGGEPGFEGGELARILYTAHDLGIADRLRLHGHLPEREVVSLLQHSDVLLQSSLSEGMPTAVLEAMACGLPVVATDVGGTGEAFEHEVEGFLVPPRDPAALADALLVLWRDPDRRRAMGEAARERAERGPTLEQQLDAFESLYRGLAHA
jgi:glycosyltransferase involved in cell wall biosynthesis